MSVFTPEEQQFLDSLSPNSRPFKDDVNCIITGFWTQRGKSYMRDTQAVCITRGLRRFSRKEVADHLTQSLQRVIDWIPSEPHKVSEP